MKMHVTQKAFTTTATQKYQNILEYLKQDEAYYLENDIWNIWEPPFEGQMKEGTKAARFIHFNSIQNEQIKNELKFYFLKSFQEKKLTKLTMGYYNSYLRVFASYLNDYVDVNTLNQIEIGDSQYQLFLINKNGLDYKVKNKKCMSFKNLSIAFITDYYYESEFDKDRWYYKNIPGAKISASMKSVGKRVMYFKIPVNYEKTVKRYMRVLVSKHSWQLCTHTINNLNLFFEFYYENGYSDGFVENLTREDIEKYLNWLNSKYQDKDVGYRCKFISAVKFFLEYIQLSEYEQAPHKDVNSLFFKDDFPRQNRFEAGVATSKSIPAPVKEQLDKAIVEIKSKKYIPLYVLLRETGWRGTDILNLRYTNCLEYIWNNREGKYNPYLCGEITKTGIPGLKIPIRPETAKMLEGLIAEAKELSTSENNPSSYLFNQFEGRFRGHPYNKNSFVKEIKKLIELKEIKGPDGSYHKFRLHSLRHTRAVEYIDQGMNLTIIQQILGHCSLKMTLEYAKISDNIMYEKWKEVEKLNILQVVKDAPEVSSNSEAENNERILRFEYVRANLDAVRVPFGVCFKPKKIGCKQQSNHCLTCASFCSIQSDIPSYEAEIKRVEELIIISIGNGREDWKAKNEEYLRVLNDNLTQIREKGIIHKNGKTREVE